jgi:hypothetical protein
VRDGLREHLNSARRHPGQVLIVFAIAIPALLAAFGLGIDVAYIFKERRQLQNVADMAALGGVSQLPDSPGSASTIAVQIAGLNGVDAESVSTTAGYNDNDNQLEVSISRSVDLLFMPVLGFDSVEISARAVAEHSSGKGTAVFAKKDYQCWPYVIEWSGKNISVDGDVHSNAGLTISGTSNATTGRLTYDGSCSKSVAGNNPSLPTPIGTSQRDWPIDSDQDDFPCTYKTNHPNLTNTANKHLWEGQNIAGKKLNPGVICHLGGSTMTLNESGVSGNVTLVAEYIKITGTGNNLTAYLNDVLMYATGSSFTSADGSYTLDVTANGGTMNGILYQRRGTDWGEGTKVPRGQMRINGSNGFTLNGSIVAWIAKLEGSGWSIVNTLEGSTEPAHLVE